MFRLRTLLHIVYNIIPEFFIQYLWVVFFGVKRAFSFHKNNNLHTLTLQLYFVFVHYSSAISTCSNFTINIFPLCYITHLLFKPDLSTFISHLGAAQTLTSWAFWLFAALCHIMHHLWVKAYPIKLVWTSFEDNIFGSIGSPANVSMLASQLTLASSLKDAAQHTEWMFLVTVIGF